MKIYLNRKHRTIGTIMCASCSPKYCRIKSKLLCKNNCNPLLHPLLHPILHPNGVHIFMHPTSICSIFYPLSITLFTFLKTLLCQHGYLSFKHLVVLKRPKFFPTMKFKKQFCIWL